jgi:hypothetical protein
MSTTFGKLAWRVLLASLLATPLVACRRHQQSRGNEPARQPAPAAPSAPTPPGEPTIDFDTRVHDFGLVTEGDPLKHVFQVINRGTAPLVLSEVRTSCGCTAALLGVTTLPPGGSGPLDVSMDTHGARGQGTRRITVSSNDPRQPTAALEIKYDVQPLLAFDRSFVQLTTTQGSDREETVWLTGQLVKPARLRADVQGTRLVTARTVETRQGDELRKGLRLKLRGKGPATGEGSLTVKTGLPNPAELSLRFAYAVN